MKTINANVMEKEGKLEKQKQSHETQTIRSKILVFSENR